MITPELSREERDALQTEILEPAFKQFTERMRKVCNETLGDLECAFLPHLLTDAESNVRNVIERALTNFMEGRPQDNWYLTRFFAKLGLETGYHGDSVRAKLYADRKEAIDNAEIASLKVKIEVLTQQLNSR